MVMSVFLQRRLFAAIDEVDTPKVVTEFITQVRSHTVCKFVHLQGYIVQYISTCSRLSIWFWSTAIGHHAVLCVCCCARSLSRAHVKQESLT